MPIYKNLPRGKKKQHDEFRDWTMHAILWIKDNWQIAVEVVVAAGFAFAIVIGASTYWNYRSDKAAGLFYEASKLAANSDEQIKKLEEIADDYSRTAAGKQSMMQLGNIFLEKKDYDKAAEIFQRLAGRSRNHAILMIAALHKTAEALYDKGDFAGAAETYLKAAADPHNLISAKSRYLAAACFEKTGNLDKAESLYKQVIEDAKDEDADRMVKEQSEERLIWLALTAKK